MCIGERGGESENNDEVAPEIHSNSLAARDIEIRITTAKKGEPG